MFDAQVGFLARKTKKNSNGSEKITSRDLPADRRPAVASTAQSSGIARRRRRRLFYIFSLDCGGDGRRRRLSMPSPGTLATRAAVGEIALYLIIIY